MTRSTTFTTLLSGALAAFAVGGCGSPDGTSDSTLSTHTASDEVTTDGDGGTAETSDGGSSGKGDKGGMGDGGCEKKPGE